MPRDAKGRVAGHLAASSALVFALAAVALLLFIPIPFDREIDTAADAPAGCEIQATTTTTQGSDAADAKPVQLVCRDSVTIPNELGLIAYPILLLPVLITGIGFWATTRDRQSLIWTICLLSLAGYLIFTISGLLFVPSMVALTIASFQTRRAEQQLLVHERSARDGSGVIDTTAVEIDDD